MIPVNRPKFQGNESKYLTECIKTGWVSSEGKYIKKFENALGQFTNRKYVSLVSSGTAALDIITKSIGIKKGDEVIVPNFTIISTIQQILKLEAKPIFIDSSFFDWNMNIDLIELKITKKTKAIFIVHTYGMPVDIDKLKLIKKKYPHIIIVEDSAELFGQTYKGKYCGSFFDISLFSFYANKNITTGEGGAILTNNQRFFKKFNYYKNLCFEKKRFIHRDLGWNYRMSNLQAAVGLAQIENIEKIIKRKREIGFLYNKFFRKHPNIVSQINETNYSKNIYWVYGILINKNKLKASQIIVELKKKGVDSRPFFFPLNKQPLLKNFKYQNNHKYPVSSYLYDYGLYLPSGVGVTNKEIKISAETLISII